MKAKPKSCSVHPCTNTPEVALRAKPPAPKDNRENVWWLCRSCAPAYERMGYEPVAQGSLL